MLPVLKRTGNAQHAAMESSKSQDGATPAVATLLRERQILELVPVSRATFHRWLKAGTFPPAFRLPGRIAVWRASVVREWIDRSEQASSPRVL